jgi:hypothetical protein
VWAEAGVTAEGNPLLGARPAQLSETNAPNGSPRFATLDEIPAGQAHRSAGSLWLHRFSVLMFVFFCAVLGVILVVFPWRDEWTNNALLVHYPALQDFLGNGFVRGLCSGLGLLDIWIGFWEAVHYHE